MAPQFIVMALHRNKPEGVGPATVTAKSRADAKSIFAQGEGMTLEQLEESGLVVLAEQTS